MQPLSDRESGLWGEDSGGVDASSIEILGPLKQAQALVDLALEPLFDGAPVTSPELDMLVVARGSEPPVIARRLAQRMNLSRASVSRTLAKLEGRGLVSRIANPSDRRAAIISLTAEGKKIVDTLFPAQLNREARVLRGMSPERRALVVQGLNALVESLEEAVSDPGATGDRSVRDCYVAAASAASGEEQALGNG
ncbi:MarR family winged helix-turn-helix transcriptional regulator [Nocardiopsis dassonvillei]|uniref:MarR family winged helix-turn-helix transcriptional regulator n=1 Tax=Nocardiopsis dassonvillei TaxID=2014 RepID=UPI0036381730